MKRKNVLLKVGAIPLVVAMVIGGCGGKTDDGKTIPATDVFSKLKVSEPMDMIEKLKSMTVTSDMTIAVESQGSSMGVNVNNVEKYESVDKGLNFYLVSNEKFSEGSDDTTDKTEDIGYVDNGKYYVNIDGETDEYESFEDAKSDISECLSSTTLSELLSSVSQPTVTKGYTAKELSDKYELEYQGKITDCGYDVPEMLQLVGIEEEELSKAKVHINIEIDKSSNMITSYKYSLDSIELATGNGAIKIKECTYDIAIKDVGKTTVPTDVKIETTDEKSDEDWKFEPADGVTVIEEDEDKKEEEEDVWINLDVETEDKEDSSVESISVSENTLTVKGSSINIGEATYEDVKKSIDMDFSKDGNYYYGTGITLYEDNGKISYGAVDFTVCGTNCSIAGINSSSSISDIEAMYGKADYVANSSVSEWNEGNYVISVCTSDNKVVNVSVKSR